MKKIIFLLFFLFPIFFSSSGCGLGILAAGIGYAVSSSKSADASKTEAEAKMQQSYNQYKIEMEKINLDRERSGLKPRPIMPIDEWLKIQAKPEDQKHIAAEEPKPAKD